MAEKRNELSIREVPGATPNPSFGPCNRVRIRLDLYPEAQSIDYSIIMWRHPEARVTLNEVQVGIGPMLHDVLLTDIYAELAAIFDDHSDPFP